MITKINAFSVNQNTNKRKLNHPKHNVASLNTSNRAVKKNGLNFGSYLVKSESLVKHVHDNKFYKADLIMGALNAVEKRLLKDGRSDIIKVDPMPPKEAKSVYVRHKFRYLIKPHTNEPGGGALFASNVGIAEKKEELRFNMDGHKVGFYVDDQNYRSDPDYIVADMLDSISYIRKKRNAARGD